MVKRFIFKYWVLFFIGCLILFMAITKVSIKELWNSLNRLALWQLAILVGLFFLLSGLNVGLRKYLLLSLGQNPRLKNLWLIHFTSMAAHYSTPVKLGFPVTVLLLKKLENIDYAVGTAAVLVELVVSTGVCGLIGVLGTFYYFSERRFVPLLIGFTLACICGTFILGRISRSNPGGRIGKSLTALREGLNSLSLGRLVGYFFMRTVLQLGAPLNLFLLCIFFSSEISYLQAVVTSSAAFFVGAVSMVPMGLGVREGSVLFYLARFGVAGPVAISIVGIQRIISTGITFVIGMLLGTLLGLKNMQEASARNFRE